VSRYQTAAYQTGSTLSYAAGVTKHSGVHDLVSAGILTAVGRLLADAAELPSMAEVAKAAGVGRATLYRYFPTREVLVGAMAQAALAETEELLRAAEFDNVDLREGLVRFARVMIGARSKFEFLEGLLPVSMHDVARDKDARQRFGAVVGGMFERGVADGSLRADVTPGQHLRLFVGILKTLARAAVADGVPAERAAALVVDLYMGGAAAVQA
jgi:TetR/AcrR family transcriptional repressor of mexCD-oprJ operon